MEGKNKVKKKKSKNHWTFADIFGVLIWIGIASYLFYQCSLQTYRNHLLEKRGVQTMAYVTASYSQGNHRVADYEFIDNGLCFDGQLRFHDAEKGDSRIVIYLPEDPDINRALWDLK